ncbi:MAG: enolase C-terminal domain-like protein, partial [Acidobacteriota bacterium]|nr:enolase C-terminal domain-like protein [Acidobacteriota bacterium]
LSPHEAGGLLAFRKAAAIAEAGGVPVCLHGQSVSGITDAAQHHLGLSTPNLTDGNQIMHQLLAEDLVDSPDLTPQRGKLGLPEAPGFGVELDRDAVARAAERYRRGGRP